MIIHLVYLVANDFCGLGVLPGFIECFELQCSGFLLHETGVAERHGLCAGLGDIDMAGRDAHLDFCGDAVRVESGVGHLKLTRLRRGHS